MWESQARLEETSPKTGKRGQVPWTEITPALVMSIVEPSV